MENARLSTSSGRRTSAVILGIELPEKFPLVYYRDNCADIRGHCGHPARLRQLYADDAGR